MGIGPTAIKLAYRRTLRRIPLAAWGLLAPRDVYSPFYHVVSDEDLPHVRAYPYKDSRQLECDVVYARERFGFIEYEELVRSRLEARRVKSSRFFFTFDDGYSECFHVIRPILRKQAAPCAFFVTRDFVENGSTYYEIKTALCVSALLERTREETAGVVAELGLEGQSDFSSQNGRRRLGNRLRRVRIPAETDPQQARLCAWILGLKWHETDRIDRVCEVLGVDPDGYEKQRPIFMTAENIRQLHDEGFTIGAHGVKHRPLGELEPEEAEREIVASCDFVRQLTGQRKVPFAFPYSSSGIEAARLAELARRYDFVDLWFDTGGLGRTAPEVVNRFWADFFDDGQTVALDYPLGRYLQWHFSVRATGHGQ